MIGGLWRNHRGRGKTTQSDQLVGMLRSARKTGKPVELAEIMATGIAQHGTRFNEIRSRGFIVQNEMERVADGRNLSRYWLRFDPEHEVRQ